MPRRYYLCDVIGAGSRLDPYRAIVANLGVNHVAVLNAPASANALVLVNAADHTTLLSHPQLDALPEMSLDAAWSTISLVTRAAVLARLMARGFATGAVVGTAPFREILRSLGRQLRPEFDEALFDVA